MTFRLTKPEDRRDHLYRCSACGKETWYVTKLPEHLTKGHDSDYLNKRCSGTLEWVLDRPSIETKGAAR